MCVETTKSAFSPTYQFRKLVGHRLFGPGLISLLIKVSGAGLSYLMFVVFAHMMSEAEYGAFAFSFNLAIVIAAAIGFGFSTAILRYWPKYLATAERAKAKGTLVLGGWFTLGGSVACLLAGFSVHFILGNVGGRNYLAIAILAIAFCVGDYAAGALRAQRSVVGAMLPRDVLWRIITPALAVFYVWQNHTLSSGAAVLISAAVLFVLLLPQGLLMIRAAKIATPGVKAQVDWSEIRISFLPLWGAGIVFAMIQQLDVVIVGSLMNGAETGAYFAAQKTASLLSLVLIAGGLVTAPNMAALYHAKKFHELQTLCRQLVGAISVITLIGFVVLVLFGSLLLGIFNPSFKAAYWILLILGFGSMIDAVAGPTAYLMQMTNYEKPYMKIMVVCYGLVIAAQILLVPQWGGLGAALASASGTILWNFWAIRILRQKADLDPSVLNWFKTSNSGGR